MWSTHSRRSSSPSPPPTPPHVPFEGLIRPGRFKPFSRLYHPRAPDPPVPHLMDTAGGRKQAFKTLTSPSYPPPTVLNPRKAFIRFNDYDGPCLHHDVITRENMVAKWELNLTMQMWNFVVRYYVEQYNYDIPMCPSALFTLGKEALMKCGGRFWFCTVVDRWGKCWWQFDITEIMAPGTMEEVLGALKGYESFEQAAEHGAIKTSNWVNSGVSAEMELRLRREGPRYAY